MLWLTAHQLKSGSTKARQKAAKELWREANPRALEYLAKALLTDPDSEVRQVAASALGRLQEPARLEPLLKALQDAANYALEIANRPIETPADKDKSRALASKLRALYGS